MSSRKNLGRVGIPKNVEISLIDLAPIACYKLQDIRALHLKSTFFSPEKPGPLGQDIYLKSGPAALRDVDRRFFSSQTLFKQANDQ